MKVRHANVAHRIIDNMDLKDLSDDALMEVLNAYSEFSAVLEKAQGWVEKLNAEEMEEDELNDKLSKINNAQVDVDVNVSMSTVKQVPAALGSLLVNNQLIDK
jgi:oligoendopeptidase F